MSAAGRPGVSGICPTCGGAEHKPAPVFQYHIWSHEHRMWWCANSSGYTDKLKDAGVYSRDEAADIVMDHIPPGEEIAVDVRFAAMAERELRSQAALLWGGAK